MPAPYKYEPTGSTGNKGSIVVVGEQAPVQLYFETWSDIVKEIGILSTPQGPRSAGKQKAQSMTLTFVLDDAVTRAWMFDWLRACEVGREGYLKTLMFVFEDQGGTPTIGMEITEVVLSKLSAGGIDLKSDDTEYIKVEGTLNYQGAEPVSI